MSARVTALPAGIWMLGETFHPTPSSLAAAAPVPSEAAPPAPLPPVRFSALTERLRPAVSNDIPGFSPRSFTGNPSVRQHVPHAGVLSLCIRRPFTRRLARLQGI